MGSFYDVGKSAPLTRKVRGMAAGPALRLGVVWGHLLLIVAFVLIVIACYTIHRDTARVRSGLTAVGVNEENVFQ